jgi:hypothetical protein
MMLQAADGAPLVEVAAVVEHRQVPLVAILAVPIQILL